MIHFLWEKLKMVKTSILKFQRFSKEKSGKQSCLNYCGQSND